MLKETFPKSFIKRVDQKERKGLIKKEEDVEKIAHLINQFSVVGVLNMHKLPARQLQKIKDQLRGTAVIRVSKKSLLLRAFDKSERDLDELKEKIMGEPALILTNENPFSLYKKLKESRSPAPAKAGDIAPHDIVIPKGPTPLPPGPAISSLQKIGLKTTVQQGKIAVTQEKIVAKEGEKITEDAVNVLNLLKMEPMEVGLDLVSAWENGTIYGKDLLDIDQSFYINELYVSVQKAVNLSVNTGYSTKLTIEIILSKAFTEAKALCIGANILEKQFIDDVLIKAIREFKALENQTTQNKPTPEASSDLRQAG